MATKPAQLASWLFRSPPPPSPLFAAAAVLLKPLHAAFSHEHGDLLSRSSCRDTDSCVNSAAEGFHPEGRSQTEEDVREYGSSDDDCHSAVASRWVDRVDVIRKPAKEIAPWLERMEKDFVLPGGRSMGNIRINCDQLKRTETRCFSSSAPKIFDVDAGQPTPWSHPELLAPGEIVPGISARDFSQRRDNVMSKLPPGSVLIVGSAEVKYMAGVIPYPYRQDADYLYLTGCQQPGGVFILEKRAAESEPMVTMFMPEASRDLEVWNGHVADVDTAMNFFGADSAYPLRMLEKELGSILDRANHIYYDTTSSSRLHSKAQPLAAAALSGRLKCPRAVLHQARWQKAEAEVRLMRHSCSIASQAMTRSMQASTACPNEWHVAAVMEYECRQKGAQRMAFPSVVASGGNACTIHYSRNDQQVSKGDMVLMDAGCEYYGYASDITRVWPPRGTFSPAQREVYEEVLAVLKECTALCQPGVTLRQLHNHSVVLLSKSISRLGLVDDSLSQITKSTYRRFYPTSVGHWLGMDTHDCSTVPLSQPLKPGVILTLEPGLYIRPSESVSQRYAGIGVRIEDDILITEDGYEVLTAGVPKEVHEIEALLHG